MQVNPATKFSTSCHHEKWLSEQNASFSSSMLKPELHTTLKAYKLKYKTYNSMSYFFIFDFWVEAEHSILYLLLFTTQTWTLLSFCCLLKGNVVKNTSFIIDIVEKLVLGACSRIIHEDLTCVPNLELKLQINSLYIVNH